jgi:hypothetical protein
MTVGGLVEWEERQRYVKGNCFGVWRTDTLFGLHLSTSCEWITENSLSFPVIFIAAKT